MSIKPLHVGSWCVGIGILALSVGCAVDLKEEFQPCPRSQLVHSAHSWGGNIALRPNKAHDWCDLLKEPFGAYAYPTVTIEILEDQFGTPTRRFTNAGRPFVEYSVDFGQLRFGLEEQRSGSAVHRSWRLRLAPEGLSLDALLKEEAFDCLRNVLRPDVDVLLLARDDRPKIEAKIRDGNLAEVVWLNIDGHPPS